MKMKTKKERKEIAWKEYKKSIEQVLEVKENADRLIANPKDFATMEIGGKEYILITRLQLLAVMEYIEKSKDKDFVKMVDTLRISENSRLQHNLDGIETDFLLSAKEIKQKIGNNKNENKRRKKRNSLGSI